MTVSETRELSWIHGLRLDAVQPFNFRYTFWKPSHFPTGLEAHSLAESWRTFRVDGLICGVHARLAGDGAVMADVYGDGALPPAQEERLRRRLRWSYGLDEDLSAFREQCLGVPAMRAPLARLEGMRQSCPESPFEIAVISLLLQNATIARTAQMMRNLLAHYGHVVRFAGQELRAFFTPQEIAGIPEDRLRAEDRLGYRAKYLPRFAAFFAGSGPQPGDGDRAELTARFQEIKGVGPYTAAIIASHASRDPSALGLDVWNRKLLARALMGVQDAEPSAVMAAATSLFPGYQALASLYIIEHQYADNPASPLLAAQAALTANPAPP
jgi:3-methyladenine DNA glycosylase/8-oxoguanine DNA glycosylase